MISVAKAASYIYQRYKEEKDIVASHVVLLPEDMVWGVYSLRCGELYKEVDSR